MSETEKILSQLRDIHEPLPPTGLPISIWWITTAVAAIVLLGLVLMLRHKKQQQTTDSSTTANQVAVAKTEPTEQARLRMARLLRAHMKKNSASTQQLTGEAWLQALDEHLNTTWFTQGEGRQFGDALYQPATQSLSEEAYQQLQHLLEQATPA